MKSLLTVVVLLALLVSLVAACTSEEETAPGTSKPGEVIELKFATIESETHWRTPFMRWFAEELDKRTGGRTKTTVFTGGALGGSSELPYNITKGVCEMGFIVPNAIQGLIPLDAFFMIPLFMSDPGARSYVAQDMISKGYYKLDGAKILMANGTEPPALFLTKKKVENLEDFRGLVLGGVPASSPICEALGARLEPLPPPEIYSGFERGLVDGGILGTGLAESLNLQEVVKYVAWHSLANGLHICIMNLDKYNSLPSDIKLILLDLNNEANYELTRLCYEETTKAYDYWKAQEGVEVYTMGVVEWNQVVDMVKDWPTKTAADLDTQGQPGTEALNLALQDLGAMGTR